MPFDIEEIKPPPIPSPRPPRQRRGKRGRVIFGEADFSPLPERSEWEGIGEGDSRRQVPLPEFTIPQKSFGKVNSPPHAAKDDDNDATGEGDNFRRKELKNAELKL